ncbi:MipA/OmpV family protein [Klebsiella aerogenes]|uniref:MipA/OmpV family protein n=1 Tax=Klebsiella aerogenes TaxID=548 RepID=UPI002FFC0E5D
MAPTDDWGTFTASFPEGLRWDLPTGDLFGVALLGNYDPGRKESIRTLSGHNHHLRGMGDLGGTPMAGMDLSVNYAPYRLFVRGMQALRERHYGGEDLGRTAWLDVGVGANLPLSGSLGMSLETFASWSDRHDMMARFGVTREQAEHAQFQAHEAGGGLRGVTMRWGLDWQYSPNWRYEGGVQMTALTSKAVRNSPLTEKNVSGGLFLNALYTF